MHTTESLIIYYCGYRTGWVIIYFDNLCKPNVWRSKKKNCYDAKVEKSMDDIGAYRFVDIMDIAPCTRCVEFVGFQIRYNMCMPWMLG